MRTAKKKRTAKGGKEMRHTSTRATDGKNGFKNKPHSGGHKARHHDGPDHAGGRPTHVGNKAMGKRLRGLEGRLEGKAI